MKRGIIKILAIIIILVIIATIVAYFKYADREWLSFYIACGGGLIVVNLSISLIFVHKNFKDKS